VVHTAAELRRAASQILDGGAPYLLVRQAFAAAPRARFALRRERDLPTLAIVGGAVDERALLPLDAADAAVLARAAGGPASSPALADLLLRTAACADEQGLELEVEVFLGQPPVVVAAAGRTIR